MNLLTIGQSLPSLGLYSVAKSFRADLSILARTPRVPWLDSSSTHDLLCFADVNPYQACGLPAPVNGAYPQRQLLDLRAPRNLKRKRDFLSVLFELHFDYLRDSSAGFDLRGLIAGEVDC